MIQPDDDIITVRGDVELKLYDGATKALKYEAEVRNLVTTAGKNFIVRKMMSTAAAPDNEKIETIAIGAGVTFTYNITTSTTVISGSDSFGNTLSYTPGKVTVTKNGALLDPSLYTATSGSAVVLATPAVNGDTIRVFSAVVTPSDTELQGQLAIEPIQFNFVDQIDTNKAHYISTFAENIGTGTIREVGLFSDSSPAKLICRTALTTPFVKAATDYLVVNWKLQIG